MSWQNWNFHAVWNSVYSLNGIFCGKTSTSHQGREASMKIIALDVKVMVSSLSPFRVHLPKWPKEKMMTIYWQLAFMATSDKTFQFHSPSHTRAQIWVSCTHPLASPPEAVRPRQAFDSEVTCLPKHWIWWHPPHLFSPPKNPRKKPCPGVLGAQRVPATWFASAWCPPTPWRGDSWRPACPRMPSCAYSAPWAEKKLQNLEASWKSNGRFLVIIPN